MLPAVKARPWSLRSALVPPGQIPFEEGGALQLARRAPARS